MPQADSLAAIRDLEQQVQEQAQAIQQLQQQLQTVEPESTAFDRIIGDSTAVREAIALAQAVAHVDSTVLITGESGTGKELIAKGIHQASPRAGRPFVAINCATLAENLQSSELFGHVKGAFTGAMRDRPGLFEAANGGTLFLDEVAELAPSAQAALLRVLQEGVITRLGEHRERKVNVRLIAATHRDLDAASHAGAFRTDLFFRLNVVNIAMPALRDRENDVLLLSRQFIAEYNGKMNKTIAGLSPETARLFLGYGWPGNVRELRNVIESAVLLARSSVIEVGDLPACLLKRIHGEEREAFRPGKTAAVNPNWAARIAAALAKTHYKRDLAAELLGISRTTLWRKMKSLGIGD